MGDPGCQLKEKHLSFSLSYLSWIFFHSVKMRLSGVIALSMGSLAFGQTNFGGSSSGSSGSSGSSSGSTSSSQEFPLGSLDTDTRYPFLKQILLFLGFFFIGN